VNKSTVNNKKAPASGEEHVCYSNKKQNKETEKWVKKKTQQSKRK